MPINTRARCAERLPVPQVFAFSSLERSAESLWLGRFPGGFENDRAFDYSEDLSTPHFGVCAPWLTPRGATGNWDQGTSTTGYLRQMQNLGRDGNRAEVGIVVGPTRAQVDQARNPNCRRARRSRCATSPTQNVPLCLIPAWASSSWFGRERLSPSSRNSGRSSGGSRQSRTNRPGSGAPHVEFNLRRLLVQPHGLDQLARRREPRLANRPRRAGIFSMLVSNWRKKIALAGEPAIRVARRGRGVLWHPSRQLGGH